MLTHKTTRRQLGIVAIVALLSSLWIGCSEEPDSREYNPPDAGDLADVPVVEPDVPVADAGPDSFVDPPDAGCAEECGANQECVQGVCQDLSVGSQCDVAEDLGVLDPNGQISVSATPQDNDNTLKTGCSLGEGGSDTVFRFRVDEPTKLTIRILNPTNFDPVMELRAGDCEDAQAAVPTFGTGGCSDPETVEFFPQVDVDYYLIVEPRQGALIGPFDLQIDSEGVVCSPPGHLSCDGTTRVQCFAGQEERRLECADSCSNGVCGGDTCETAIEVTASGTFTGETAAYVSTFDFVDQPSCSTGGQAGPVSSGQDVIFFLPGLQAGQTVYVDALTNDTNTNVIGVLSSCSLDAGCVAASSQGEELTWEVEQGGDYYIVVNKTSSTARDFQYSIEIRD